MGCYFSNQKLENPRVDPAGKMCSSAGGLWNLQSPWFDTLDFFLKLVMCGAPLDQPPSPRMFAFSAALGIFNKEASKP